MWKAGGPRAAAAALRRCLGAGPPPPAASAEDGNDGDGNGIPLAHMRGDARGDDGRRLPLPPSIGSGGYVAFDDDSVATSDATATTTTTTTATIHDGVSVDRNNNNNIHRLSVFDASASGASFNAPVDRGVGWTGVAIDELAPTASVSARRLPPDAQRPTPARRLSVAYATPRSAAAPPFRTATTTAATRPTASVASAATPIAAAAAVAPVSAAAAAAASNPAAAGSRSAVMAAAATALTAGTATPVSAPSGASVRPKGGRAAPLPAPFFAPPSPASPAGASSFRDEESGDDDDDVVGEPFRPRIVGEAGSRPSFSRRALLQASASEAAAKAQLWNER